MSFKAIDDINKSVATKVQNFRRKNSQISLPTTTKTQLDRITEDSRRYMADFGRINLETEGHQEGGQFRQIDSPQNMTVPTLFMQTVHRTQCERKKTMEAKCIEVKDNRDIIRGKKKEADEEIHQLYDSLLQKYNEGGMVSS